MSRQVANKTSSFECLRPESKEIAIDDIWNFCHHCNHVAMPGPLNRIVAILDQSLPTAELVLGVILKAVKNAKT